MQKNKAFCEVDKDIIAIFVVTNLHRNKFIH